MLPWLCIGTNACTHAETPFNVTAYVIHSDKYNQQNSPKMNMWYCCYLNRYAIMDTAHMQTKTKTLQVWSGKSSICCWQGASHNRSIGGPALQWQHFGSNSITKLHDTVLSKHYHPFCLLSCIASCLIKKDVFHQRSLSCSTLRLVSS